LSVESCKYLNNLISKNNHIFNLSLSGCGIGPNGAEKLHNGMSTNVTLTTLDFSNCDLGNEGLKHIANSLMNNENIEVINLSHNHLDELCAEYLGKLLTNLIRLKHLDLSWNSLHSGAAWKTLVPAFRNNKSLLSLILSWNSLETACLRHLRKLIRKSQIEKLDLSCKYCTNDTYYRDNCISDIYQL